ncbi:MAG: autotransporter outer membrane beta-barrel domain-containing protein [Prosthecobacter sp.]|jgi:uncharacterized protein YhjY with autotransporter beta-barrel domain|nr:autotransporter outer membrane beta-barrel domain-containing protein [Prosthecobacter sp.]
MSLRAFPVLLLSVFFTTSPSQAIVGVNSASPGVIGNQHITFAANLDLGRTMGFVDYNNATGTGTLVPSTEAGVFKFLTAAHNVDSDNNGVLDGGAGTIKIYFGNTPGENGTGATYSVTAAANQIALNPLWSTAPGGVATNDLAVISFRIDQLTPVVRDEGGQPSASTLQASAVSSASPLGMQAIQAGHGLHADGTVNLGGNNIADQNQVNGILKGGTNTIDSVGVPTITVGGTITPESGFVILTDFDKPDGNTSTMGATTGGPNEVGTAKGDSGSAIFADTNSDGKLEVVGVLNGGDNNFPTGASTFGDISQYAPILTQPNLAFLQGQKIFVGLSFNGVSAGDYGGAGFAIMDAAGITNFNNGVNTAPQTQQQAQNPLQAPVGTVQARANQITRGTSNFENVGGDEVTLRELAGFGSRRWEIWASSNLGRVDSDSGGTNNGALDSRYGAATVGVDFLATSHVMVGAFWSYLYGTGHSTDLDMESRGNAVGISVLTEWYGLTNSFIYNYSLGETEIRRQIGGSEAEASPGSSSHTLDWVISYNMRHKGWVHGPTGGLRYSFGTVDGYSESSAVPVPGLMTLTGQDFSVFRVNLGYNAAYHINTDFGKIVPYFSAAWIYQSQHTSSTVASFQGTPFSVIGSGGVQAFGTGPSSAIAGSDSSQNFANVQVGVEILANKALRVNLTAYSNVFRSGTTEYGGGVQVGVLF